MDSPDLLKKIRQLETDIRALNASPLSSIRGENDQKYLDDLTTQYKTLLQAKELSFSRSQGQAFRILKTIPKEDQQDTSDTVKLISKLSGKAPEDILLEAQTTVDAEKVANPDKNILDVLAKMLYEATSST